jgi:hypothetical protein
MPGTEERALLHRRLTTFRMHPASYIIGRSPRRSFPCRPEREADSSAVYSKCWHKECMALYLPDAVRLHDAQLNKTYLILYLCRSQWPRGLGCGFVAPRLLRLRVRIPPGHGCLSRVCRVLSSRDFCVGMITRPEEFYRALCLIVIVNLR